MREVITPDTSGQFALVFTAAAESDVRSAMQWLQGFDERAPERFAQRLEEELTLLSRQLPREINDGERWSIDLPQKEESLLFARPIYRFAFQAMESTESNEAECSNAGLWYVYYTLEDKDTDGFTGYDYGVCGKTQRLRASSGMNRIVIIAIKIAKKKY